LTNQNQLNGDALTPEDKDAVIASLKAEVDYLRREIDAWRNKPTNAQVRAPISHLSTSPPRSRKVLFLDDNPSRARIFRSQIDPSLSCTYVTTAADAIRALENDRHTLVFLDHDLDPDSEGQAGSPPNSGMTVAKYLAGAKDKAVYMKVIVHSLNRPRAMEMLRLLGEANYACAYIPFTERVAIGAALYGERELSRKV